MPTVPHAGELAALGTAACWIATALSFEAAGKRIGSLTVNLLRMPFALVLLSLTAWAVRGVALPTDATAFHWTWLSVSGLVGFAFGDLCLFRAFVVLGPRLSTLVMSLAPPIAAVLGWAWLEETLAPRDLLGMALTLGGIAWAVLARDSVRPAAARRPLAGVLLALGGAVGQGAGLVLSKLGMGSYSALAATQIRVLAGLAGYVLLFTVFGWWPRVPAALADRRAMGPLALGAFFGPFLGVTLSLVAVRHTTTGVAASLMATTPVLIIPVVVLLGKERVGLGGVAGAVLAVAGVVVLFL